MRMAKGKSFMRIPYEGPGRGVEGPVFSEKVLYPRLGKGDARFVLGVAEEYEHIIEALGPKGVKALLGVKPQLVRRLGTGEVVADHLEDARDEMDLWREEQHPEEIKLDRDAADQVFDLLFHEYQRNFNPDKTMADDSIRLLEQLAEDLGPEWQRQLQEEKDKLPEKLKQQKKRKKEVEKRTVARNKLLSLAGAYYRETGQRRKYTKAEAIAIAEEWAEANGYK